MTKQETDILPATQDGEDDMFPHPKISCPECARTQPFDKVNEASIAIVPVLGAGMTIEGVLSCERCGYRWPVRLRNDELLEISQSMPVAESTKLVNVPDGIKQDIEEAERTHFARAYKASAVMCRRAMLLGLVEKKVEDQPAAAMLEKAQKGGVLIDDRIVAQMSGVIDYGHGGAHRHEEYDPQEIANMTTVARIVLNYLFDPSTNDYDPDYEPPAKKSRKRNNAQ